MKKIERKTPKSLKALEKIALERIDDLWDFAVEYGVWMRFEAAPTLEDYHRDFEIELLEESTDEKRFAELENGAEPTKKELKRYQEAWVEKRFNNDDADLVPGYALASVSDSTGNTGVALILRKGYSFSGVSSDLEGVFTTSKAAKQYMKERGWVR